MANIVRTAREGWDGQRRVRKVLLRLNHDTLSTREGQAWSPRSSEGGLRTWLDELEPARKVEIAGIRVVPLHLAGNVADMSRHVGTTCMSLQFWLDGSVLPIRH